jgi:hypothetical protein
MKKSIVLVLILLAGFTLNSFAQPGFGPSFGNNKVSVISGDLKFLKGQTSLKLEYNYDDMLVGSMKESEYIEKHTAELNKAKPGSGDDWKVKWVKDRADRFQPAFEDRFIKPMSKAGITASQAQTDAKYKLVIKTIVTEPGLYTGVSYAEKPTFINVEASFVDAVNPGDALCKISCIKMIGDAGEFANYDIGLRISKAYENCGFYLSNYIVKELKKIK